MRCSVVIRTLDEADRLRLTLTSLACQSAVPEVIVVNDGSADHTEAVIAEFRGRLELTALRHAAPRGRCAASNAGAAAASGDIVLFLDGDTLLHPDCVRLHLAAHAAEPAADLLCRGETWHLRCTRLLLDPETASPRPGEEARVAAMRAGERERLKVTRRQIEEDFTAIIRRASPGIYPGAGPRALYELEIDALANHQDCSVLWAASSGSNFSVPRARFCVSGGFDVELDNNEHRELALRLCTGGARMALVRGAVTYHMTHRSGWRDPLVESDWERVFYRRHPARAVKLLSVFWACLADRNPLPPEAHIASLPELERLAGDGAGVDVDAIRRLIPGLQSLEAFH